ncbi:MAG: ribonuclease H-like domain-containing protein [Alphaproteobacteria bacterium]|nr:ribonuclease H-like domain-containing protein [Alphaproteobacteria bacterium]
MNKVLIFDIETQDAFSPIKTKPTDLNLSVLGIYYTPTKEYIAFTQEDLSQAWKYFEQADFIVGFNNNHFDTPILQKYAPFDLTKKNNVDILEHVKHSLGRRLKLNSIAEATLGEKKSGSGLEAVRWWQEGRIDLIKKYCLDDVRITYEIYMYALTHEKLLYRDFSLTREIPIDISQWKTTIPPEAANTTLF